MLRSGMRKQAFVGKRATTSQKKKTTLPDKFVGTVATSPSPLNVGLHDPKYKRAKNNIARGRGAKGYRVGVFTIVSQLIISGNVVSH